MIGWSQKISSLKQCWRFVFGYVLELNHLLPYIYYRGNLTLTANIYLAGLQALDDQRACILDTYLFPLFHTSPQAILATYQNQTFLPAGIKSLYPTYEQRPKAATLEIVNLFLI